MPGRDRVLGVAAATGRIGCVLLIEGKPHHWLLSKTAARSREDAVRFAKDWITRLRPDTVVTEKTAKPCRKGKKTKGLIQAVAKVAADAGVYDIAVERPRRYKNKYVEAAALAERFPDLKARLPKHPKLWQTEPHTTTIFEALVLALEVVDREYEEE